MRRLTWSPARLLALAAHAIMRPVASSAFHSTRRVRLLSSPRSNTHALPLRSAIRSTGSVNVASSASLSSACCQCAGNANSYSNPARVRRTSRSSCRYSACPCCQSYTRAGHPAASGIASKAVA
ncbi:YD repeat domain protein [Burkholderia pseudomallei MSHR5609]|nr:YD repeat domain protein [Burkholderia pseudomallei MSHR5609]KGX54093.1 YD repeat domain protein [Burkholderia pseudomallei TSV44]